MLMEFYGINISCVPCLAQLISWFCGLGFGNERFNKLTLYNYCVLTQVLKVLMEVLHSLVHTQLN